MMTWKDFAHRDDCCMKKRAYDDYRLSQLGFDSSLVGAGIGSVGGAILASIAGDRKKRIKNAILGALAGAGLGGVSGYVIGKQDELNGRILHNGQSIGGVYDALKYLKAQ